jgi:hypothetical protein
MPFAAHRDKDDRSCGAKTVVTNQSTVYVNGELWAVKGDKNTDGNGGLKATTGQTVFVEGKNVIVHGPDNADPDNKCPIPGGEHCNPKTAKGSTDTFIY